MENIVKNERFENGKLISEALAKLISYIEGEEYIPHCTKYYVNGFEYYVRIICQSWLRFGPNFIGNYNEETEEVEGNYVDFLKSGLLLQLDFADKYSLETKLKEQGTINTNLVNEMEKYQQLPLDLYGLNENGMGEEKISFSPKFQYLSEFINNLMNLKNNGINIMDEETLYHYVKEFIITHPELLAAKKQERLAEYELKLRRYQKKLGLELSLTNSQLSLK